MFGCLMYSTRLQAASMAYRQVYLRPQCLDGRGEEGVAGVGE